MVAADWATCPAACQTRARSVSSARPVTTMKSHGCEFRADGARRPASRIRSSSAWPIGWLVKLRTLRRALMASHVSIGLVYHGAGPPGLLWGYGAQLNAGQPTGTGVSSAISWSAVRAADRRAHRPLVSSPRISTASPQPVMIHQPTWLAAGKPVRSEPASTVITADPTTATPRDWPTWRLVDAMAAATPAWVTGMPDTAVFVIGAFTSPNPMPKMT